MVGRAGATVGARVSGKGQLWDRVRGKVGLGQLWDTELVVREGWTNYGTQSGW